MLTTLSWFLATELQCELLEIYREDKNPINQVINNEIDTNYLDELFHKVHMKQCTSNLVALFFHIIEIY